MVCYLPVDLQFCSLLQGIWSSIVIFLCSFYGVFYTHWGEGTSNPLPVMIFVQEYIHRWFDSFIHYVIVHSLYRNKYVYKMCSKVHPFRMGGVIHSSSIALVHGLLPWLYIVIASCLCLWSSLMSRSTQSSCEPGWWDLGMRLSILQSKPACINYITFLC